MANEEHLVLLKKGSQTWNAWRNRFKSGSILQKQDPTVQPDLRDADLSNVDLGGFNLSGVNLEGASLVSARFYKSNLKGANLKRIDASRAFFVRADLSEADLYGSILTKANLIEAILLGASLKNSDLRGANFETAKLCKIDFSGSDLSRASFIRSDLSEANLSSANLTEAKLLGANLSQVNLQGANLSQAYLDETDLSSAYLKDTNFHEVVLGGVRLGKDLSGLNFSRVNFSRKNLTSINFSNANLTEADFSEAILSESNFQGSELIGAIFSNANLAKADLSELDLTEANFSGANLSGANLSRTNLSRAIFSFNVDISTLSKNEHDLLKKNPTGSKARAIIRKAISEQAANLEGANLEGANLEGANLEGANLEAANLEGANLEGANLRRASLKNAEASEARFEEANIEETNFEGTCFTKAIVSKLIPIFNRLSLNRFSTYRSSSSGSPGTTERDFNIISSGTDSLLIFCGSSSGSPMATERDFNISSGTVESSFTGITTIETPKKPPSLVCYPNLDSPDKTIINQSFSLFVQLLLESPEEDSASAEVEDTGTDKLPKVEVVLRTHGFELEGSNTQEMEVDRSEDSEIRFVLTPQQLGEQQIRVDFYQHGRRISTSRRNILIIEQPVSTRVAQPKLPISIEMKPQPIIPAPDLELCIELDRHDDRTLSFTLHSTKEAIDLHHAKAGQVKLQGSPLEKMQAVYQELSYLAVETSAVQTDVNLGQRKLLPVDSVPSTSTKGNPEKAIRRLTSVGNQFWDELIPNELKQQYWQFRPHVKSMLITSDEPWVPWEMVKPYRYQDGKLEQDPFWCQQFSISRWLSGPGTADELPAKTVVSVAPAQSNLFAVQEELNFLAELAAFHPELYPSTTFSKVLELTDYVTANQFSILHFACHGMFDGTLPNDSAILLSDGVLRPSDIHMYFDLNMPRPLIFINACHGGRVGLSFTGLGGWAELFVKARVGAFVGAMWEVNDHLALIFAKTFYKALLQDKKTIAVAFQDSRETIRQIAPHNSTWLAYSLYADPEAKVQSKGSNLV